MANETRNGRYSTSFSGFKIFISNFQKKFLKSCTLLDFDVWSLYGTQCLKLFRSAEFICIDTDLTVVTEKLDKKPIKGDLRKISSQKCLSKNLIYFIPNKKGV